MKVQLTYTEKDKKPRKKMFIRRGDAEAFLEKLEQVAIIEKSEIKEIVP